MHFGWIISALFSALFFTSACSLKAGSSRLPASESHSSVKTLAVAAMPNAESKPSQRFRESEPKPAEVGFFRSLWFWVFKKVFVDEEMLKRRERGLKIGDVRSPKV